MYILFLLSTFLNMPVIRIIISPQSQVSLCSHWAAWPYYTVFSLLSPKRCFEILIRNVSILTNVASGRGGDIEQKLRHLKCRSVGGINAVCSCYLPIWRLLTAACSACVLCGSRECIYIVQLPRRCAMPRYSLCRTWEAQSAERRSGICLITRLSPLC